MILRRRAHAQGEMLLALIEQLAQQNPFQHRITPGGHRMSVAMTNCGDLGWSSDARGYQYSGEDNLTGRRWPPMPEAFRARRWRRRRRRALSTFSPTPV